MKPRPGALCQTWQTKEVHGWPAWPRLAWPRFFADRLGKNSILSKAEARPAQARQRQLTIATGRIGHVLRSCPEEQLWWDDYTPETALAVDCRHFEPLIEKASTPTHLGTRTAFMSKMLVDERAKLQQSFSEVKKEMKTMI